MRAQTQPQLQQGEALLCEGDILLERYLVERLLGRGGFGQVYLARDLLWGADLALKVSLRSLRREGQVLSNLDHPRIPCIYRSWKRADRSFLVMDYIEGYSLRQLLRELAAGNRWLAVPEILRIAIDLCDVLEYLHTLEDPLVFCDLKPGNVLFTSGRCLYLVDFGSARWLSWRAPSPGRLPGTLGYASPEYCAGEVTPLADIFSLGALLHHLLTGDDPAERPQQPFRRLWSPFGRVIMRMVEPDPRRRAHSASELKPVFEDLRQQQLRQRGAGHVLPWQLVPHLLLTIDRGEIWER